jgi:hypothetical protein
MRVVRKTHANYGAVGQDAAGRSIFDSMSAINKKSHAEAQRRRGKNGRFCCRDCLLKHPITRTDCADRTLRYNDLNRTQF